MKKLTMFSMLFLIITLNAKSQELTTIGEVFNFNIEDEFHLRGPIGQWTSFITTHEKIIDVNYSLDSNEVNYTIAREVYSTIFGILDTIPYLIDTISIEYTNLNSSMFYYDDIFSQDTIHYFDDNLCGAEIYGANHTFDGPEGIGVFERKWGIGIGLVRDYSAAWTGSSETELVYYIKNGVECNPANINVGIEPLLNPSSVSVFPTLFANKLTIESNYKDELTVSIYSLTGQELLNQQITSSSIQLDLGFVEAGTYIYLINREKDNHVIKSGKIIKGE
jgi:hypothetical protein